MKSIGERIKEARKSAGLTQLELAKKNRAFPLLYW